MAIRIPNAVAEDARVNFGDHVDVHCDPQGRIILSKVENSNLTEESILASLDGSNLEGEYWDGPVGREEL